MLGRLTFDRLLNVLGVEDRGQRQEFRPQSVDETRDTTVGTIEKTTTRPRDADDWRKKSNVESRSAVDFDQT